MDENGRYEKNGEDGKEREKERRGGRGRSRVQESREVIARDSQLSKNATINNSKGR